MNRLCVVTEPPYTNTPQMDGCAAVNITIVVIFHITLTSHGPIVNRQRRSNHMIGLQQNTNTHRAAGFEENILFHEKISHIK